MIESDRVKTQNCPQCDFSEREPIAPLNIGDGICLCRNCGNRWRVIGGNKIECSAENLALTENCTICDEKRKLVPFILSSPPGFAIVTLVIFVVVFISVFKSVEPATGSRISNGGQALNISGIRVENFGNGAGKIWIVTGEIRNNSDQKRVVPSVIMYAGEKGSSGYFSRTYHPALQKLAPGAKFRFRTSFRKPVGGSNFIRVKFAGA